MRIVVINNDGGGIFEFLPQAGQIDRDEFEALLGTPLGLEPERVAALYGTSRYARLDEPRPARRAADGTGADRGAHRSARENVALHARLRELAAAAVAARSAATSAGRAPNRKARDDSCSTRSDRLDLRRPPSTGRA